MQVKNGDRTCLDYTRAKAEPAADVLTSDYYTLLPQILLTGNRPAHSPQPDRPTEVMLDDQDVARLIECALRHPAVNMRNSVLAAIWNHPESFRQIFRFGLQAPAAYSEIRKIVVEELARHQPTAEALGDAALGKPALLPRMPLPAHLRGETGK
jgi:hypothetical protein